jgi:hypothetical protein
MKVAFIFIPSPSMLIGKNSDISNVFAEVYGKAFEKLGIARTGRPCIALFYRNKKKSKKRKDKEGGEGNTILKQEIAEATREALE